ncbi:17019_t:CDS:10 [Dentiscutata erythropus]|uniref:Ataxin-3 homolog n=1 Tax=Dentiscutata erythropus TaxID=1348616 RepID=A0A9N9AQ64_9GLOM|nr:17019_t:CDS:10 [Dentiscutata erythropus]
MDLSWCPVCDRRIFTLENLYCSEACKRKDAIRSTSLGCKNCSDQNFYEFSRCSSRKPHQSPHNECSPASTPRDGPSKNIRKFKFAMSDLIPYIIWEKQEGYLCAQHCINSLLQGEYFTAVDLSEIAKNLDQAEHAALQEGVEQIPTGLLGENASAQKSQNMDDSGFFSVQVLSHALKVWNLELVPVGSEEGRDSKKAPEDEEAYICNLREHWFTLRKFGGIKSRWYNLDSLFNGPEWISQIYLGMLLKQLETDGTLPTSQADEYAISHPEPSKDHSSYDSDLNMAIAASLKSVETAGRAENLNNTHNQNLNSKDSANDELSIDDLRAKRLARFENKNV